jgi:hypothetical protein
MLGKPCSRQKVLDAAAQLAAKRSDVIRSPSSAHGGKALFFPDYFVDRARKCLDVAKRMRNPKLAQAFADRARVLAQTAMEAGRTLARMNPRSLVVSSKAKALGELKRELQDLSDGMGLCVPIRDYSPNQRNELWRASPHMGQQFGCSAEYRPDGCLWFVKRRM